MKKLLAAVTFIAAWLSPISPLSANNYYEPTCDYCAPSCQTCCTPPFNGFYVGGNIGFTSLRTKHLDRDEIILSVTSIADDTSWTAGIQLGYDWQFYCDCLTLGLVVDWNWSEAETRISYFPNTPGSDNRYETRLRWFTTLRARVGHAFNDIFLLYFTGGAAVGDLRTRLHLSPPYIAINEEFTFKHNRWGWTAGFGAEFAFFCNWNWNAELLYMRFANKQVSYPTPGGFSPAGTTLLQEEAWVGRIGVNYRFSFGTGW